MKAKAFVMKGSPSNNDFVPESSPSSSDSEAARTRLVDLPISEGNRTRTENIVPALPLPSTNVSQSHPNYQQPVNVAPNGRSPHHPLQPNAVQAPGAPARPVSLREQIGFLRQKERDFVGHPAERDNLRQYINYLITLYQSQQIQEPTVQSTQPAQQSQPHFQGENISQQQRVDRQRYDQQRQRYIFQLQQQQQQQHPSQLQFSSNGPPIQSYHPLDAPQFQPRSQPGPPSQPHQARPHYQSYPQGSGTNQSSSPGSNTSGAKPTAGLNYPPSNRPPVMSQPTNPSPSVVAPVQASPAVGPPLTFVESTADAVNLVAATPTSVATSGRPPILPAISPGAEPHPIVSPPVSTDSQSSVSVAQRRFIPIAPTPMPDALSLSAKRRAEVTDKCNAVASALNPRNIELDHLVKQLYAISDAGAHSKLCSISMNTPIFPSVIYEQSILTPVNSFVLFDFFTDSFPSCLKVQYLEPRSI